MAPNAVPPARYCRWASTLNGQYPAEWVRLGDDETHLLRTSSISADVIRHAVWLYLRFTLSYRDVEDLLAERGIEVSNESIRRWVLKFGPGIARNLRKARPKPQDRWHLDEIVISIAGQRLHMWRAGGRQRGRMLDVLVQRRRDKAAALRLLRKLLLRQGFFPTVIITDKLGFYGAALRTIGFSGQHEQGLRTNNRAENSHQPVRLRERKMGRFKSPSQLSALFRYTQCLQHLQCSTNLICRRTHRQFRAEAHGVWSHATAAAA